MLLQILKDPEILHCNLDITIVAHNGREEEGKGQGVLREVLTSFWTECFRCLTVGSMEKVPCTRHVYQKTEWEAFGLTIAYGYFVVNYHPRAFVATVLFREEGLNPEFLIESLKLFISAFWTVSPQYSAQ